MNVIGTRGVHRHKQENRIIFKYYRVRRNYLGAPISSEHYLNCSDDYHRRRDVVATLDAYLARQLTVQAKPFSSNEKILYSSP